MESELQTPPISPENSNPQSTPLNSSVPQRKSFIFPITILIALISLGTAAYFAYKNYQLRQQTSQSMSTQTPPPAEAGAKERDLTANWKTYTNTLYKYSVKYPTSWTAKVIAAGAGMKEPPQDANGLDIYDPGKTTAIYPEEVVTIQAWQLMPTFDQNFKKSDVTFNGLKAIKYEEQLEGNLKELLSVVYIITTPQSNNFIEIDYRYNPSKSTLSVFDQILSTFRFTIAPTVTQGQLTKVYFDPKYKYTFNYPNNWGKGNICEGDAEKDVVRIGLELLSSPNSNCGTANIPSPVMFYITASYTPYSGYSTSLQKQINLNGKSGTYYIYKIINRQITAGPSEFAQVVIPLDENHYLIGETNSAEFISTFDQILSTFKFTN